MEPLFQSGLEYRIPIYIAFGLVCEVLFTGIYDLARPDFLKSWNVFSNLPQANIPDWRKCRDVRAVGYTFLWMLPIYALLCLVEPLVLVLAPFPFYVRGLIYALCVWVFEYVGGWLMKKISGQIPWDYSLSKTQIHGLIRLDFLPYWFAFGLSAEWLVKKMLILTPYLKQVL
ncbi:MAG: putative membrane protein [uncultured bacterium]|nr:MAG: putative membrane protein [uncultured bacterium]